MVAQNISTLVKISGTEVICSPGEADASWPQSDSLEGAFIFEKDMQAVFISGQKIGLRSREALWISMARLASRNGQAQRPGFAIEISVAHLVLRDIGHSSERTAI